MPCCRKLFFSLLKARIQTKSPKQYSVFWSKGEERVEPCLYSYYLAVLSLSLAATNCWSKAFQLGTRASASFCSPLFPCSLAKGRRQPSTARCPPAVCPHRAAFGFHFLPGAKFLFLARSVLTGISSRCAQALPCRAGRVSEPPPSRTQPALVPVRSRPRHDGGGEEEPAMLQAVHREEPEPRLHPGQHDGLAVGR